MFGRYLLNAPLTSSSGCCRGKEESVYISSVRSLLLAGNPELQPVRGGHGQQCCHQPQASPDTALALSPPVAVWQMRSRTRGISCRAPMCTDGHPCRHWAFQQGLPGRQSQEQEQWELRWRRQPQAWSRAELSQGQVLLPQLRCWIRLIIIRTKATGQRNPNGLLLTTETIS